MKTWRNYFSNRGFWLPAILTISLFLVIMGMRTPILKIHNPKERPRAVFETETRVKVAKTVLEKNVKTVDLCFRTDQLINPPLFYVTAFHNNNSNNNSTLVFSVPSRAPPAKSA